MHGNQETSPVATRTIQFAFIGLAVLVWYYVAGSGKVSPLFLPPLEAVATAFRRLVASGQFWSAVRVTLLTILHAYGIAVVSGLIIGYLVSRSRFSTRLFEPLIAACFSIPITLFFPIFILMFGIGPASKVAYGAVYGFFPIALNTIAGLSEVDSRYVLAAKSMGAKPVDMFRHVLFPAAFPVVLTGLRIGFFISFASVLGGEAISSTSGIGNNIALAAELMEPARMFAWIVFVVVTAIILNMVVSQVESRRREY